MITEQGDKKMSVGKGSRAQRALFINLALLLALALNGCEGYYVMADRLVRQSNVELVHVLTEPAARGADTVAFVNDTVLAIGADDGVSFVDVRDPEEPTLVGVFSFADELDPIYVSIMPVDGYVYATTDDTDDLIAIDIRDLTSPREANRVRGARGHLEAAEGGYLYITSVLGLGIQVWGATRPPDFSVVGVYYPPQARVGVEEIDPRYRLPAVVATPRQIAFERELGAFTANDAHAVCDDWYRGRVGGVDVEGGLLYMGVTDAGCQEQQFPWRLMDEGGLWIVDVGNPEEPVPIGFLPMGKVTIDDVTVDGHYVYLAMSAKSLKIVDVSDPARPVLVGGHATPGLSRAVTVEDGVAYVLDSDSVQVFNVANPAKPVRIGMMSGNFYLLRDIAVRANHVFLAGQNYDYWESKIFVLRLIDPQARPEELLWGASSD